ncbi:hypothetical protein EYF80_049764 [Liparis tanakae]|uniref:Uncharacterized protein n=1 Tax=Liparis tanakae TaxID=230148 RepID=A0A4Z2FFV7_9TELE|nr:hypothetical protein EYF80_049764 [Liparis tanakae]
MLVLHLPVNSYVTTVLRNYVRELSYYYSEMSPARQQWIYTFFMHPFLSAERVAGCVFPQQSSEEWLMKNFGAFRVSARVEELSTLNMLFSGLEVLHLLSPAQKAELLLRPEVAALDNGNISLVFHSLATGGPGRDPQWTTPGREPQWTTPGREPQWTNPGEHNWTGPGYPYPDPPPSPHSSVRQVRAEEPTRV